MHISSGLVLLAQCAAYVAASPMPSGPVSEVFATATSTDASEPTFTAVSRRRTNNCSQDPRLKKIEAQAWADAGAMAEIAEKWDNGNDLQPAMNYWMGADSVKSENFWKIRSALENEKNIHHGNWIFPESVVDIYCGDTHPDGKICRYRTNPNDPKGPKVTQFASSWVERGWFYNVYNVVLCDRFFEQKQSLESLLLDMKTGKRKASNASEYKNAWGHTIYHELMHLDPVIAAEEVWDAAYYACPAAKLANQNGCSGKINWTPPGWNSARGEPHTLLNADSWAFFASGSYFQKAMKLSEPGSALNDCGIYSGANLDNWTYPANWGPEGILLASKNRTDGTYNATKPPDPSKDQIPPEDPPTPAIPYSGTALPSDLATPFDAGAYFATYTPKSTPTQTASPTATTAPVCQGNQVEGSCTMGHLPSSTPDSGPQPPVCNKVDTKGLDFLMFNDKKTNQAVADYCANLISGGVVLSADNSNPKPGRVDDAAENGGFVSITVMFDVDSCDPGTSKDNQKLDFKAFGQNKCQQYLYQTLSETCAKDSTWGDYNADFSLEGGTYAASCALWSLAGLPK